MIGRGRDAVDVAMTTHFGLTRLRQMTVWADEIVPDSPRRHRQSSRLTSQLSGRVAKWASISGALGDLVKGVGQG